jgi:hypothetical protein
MSIRTHKNLNWVATPDDAVFLKNINGLHCRFCSKRPGRKKKFLRLWHLRCHFAKNHTNENYRHVMTMLADLIKNGDLR